MTSNVDVKDNLEQKKVGTNMMNGLDEQSEKEEEKSGCGSSSHGMKISKRKNRKTRREDVAESTIKNRIKSDENDDEKTDKASSQLLYDVDETPPIIIIIFYGFQIVIVNICFCILMALLIGELICADYDFKSHLFSTICVISGLTSMMQTGLGARMPIFHGPSIVFILPIVHAATDPRWGCKDNVADNITDAIQNMTSNATMDGQKRPWEIEWEKITGSLMAAQVIEIIIGLSGILGLLVRVVRPITIGSIFILIAAWLHGIISDFAKVHWGVSFLSISLLIFFSQYINWVTIPVPRWTRKDGFSWTRFPVFELFPVLLSVVIGWVFSIVLTTAGAFTDNPDDIGYQARTDINGDNIRDSPIFRVPYPGQYSINFDVEYFLVFLVSILTTVLESFGSYHQYALSCNLPKPPRHVINRGILTEGVGGLLSASCGMGCATTTYGNMVGIIRITKVGSRTVYITGGFIMLLVGLFSKVGAVLVSIPKPVLAGPVFIGIALLCGSSFANFHNVDLARPRNQSTLGISIVAGLVLPFWIMANPESIDTGSLLGDRILNAILGVPFLVGGIVACFLDSTLPGPREDITTSTSMALEMELDIEATGVTVDLKQASSRPFYDPRIRLFDPPFISGALRRWRLAKYIPILPYPDLLEDESTNA